MSSGLLPGQSPPLAVIAPNDQRGVIYVTGALALATTLVSLMTRAYVRAGMNQSFGQDDMALGVAYIFMIAQTIAVFYATHSGLGETSSLIGHAGAVSMQRAILAGDILYIITLWTSRVSSVLFAERLSRSTRYQWIWKVFLGCTALLGFACLLIISLRCDLTHAWLYIDQHCTGLYDRWLAATIISIVFEGFLFLQLCYIILNLQMAAANKIKVMTPFGGRLLLIIPLILHLLAMPSFYSLTNGTKVSAFNMARPYIYMQITLALAVITPTFPVLQNFLRATATDFGMVSGEMTNAYGSKGDYSQADNSGRKNRSRFGASNLLSMKSLRSVNQRSVSGGEERGMEDDGIRPHPLAGHTASVTHGHRMRNTSSGGSHVSQQPIIRRDVQYAVEYSDNTA